MANKICRLCIGKKEYMLSLFDKDKEFPKKAKVCLNLEVKFFSIWDLYLDTQIFLLYFTDSSGRKFSTGKYLS